MKVETKVDIPMMICPECGNEQPDMGKGVRCEECGFYPLAPLKGGKG